MLPDRPASRPALPAAVSTLVATVVRGEPGDATVVAVHRYALYLSVRGSVLPVVTSDAVALPNAVRLAVASGRVAWGVEVGQAVQVGGGRVALPGVDVVAARTWRPARVRPVEPPRAGCSDGRRGSHLGTQLWPSGAGSESGWLADGIRAVCSDVGCSEGRRGSHVSTRLLTAAVARLVGKGPGLTPSGDDALAGALLVAHALGNGPGLADAVRARLAATTAVSAALLDAAADGYAARQVVTLVDAAVAGDPDAVRRALPAVLAIGHTSGADTVTGIRAALDARQHRTKTTGGRAA
ncbi:MAG TPA: DUF2877 domain-containing protein [Ornithinibacter sp.]|nr:DUF2877 domain-containing protein [Ornithinibacter sp.]